MTDLVTHFSNLLRIEPNNLDSNPDFEIKEAPEQLEEANLDLDVPQIAAIIDTAIDTAGLGTTSEILLENHFVDNINQETKNGLALFNSDTPAVSNDKHIDLGIKNFQKILDILKDLNAIYQWIQLTKNTKDLPMGDPNAIVSRDLLKQPRLLELDGSKFHANC
eukprot:15858-Ditylum_brightwellii.AAC.1